MFISGIQNGHCGRNRTYLQTDGTLQW